MSAELPSDTASQPWAAGRKEAAEPESGHDDDRHELQEFHHPLGQANFFKNQERQDTQKGYPAAADQKSYQ